MSQVTQSKNFFNLGSSGSLHSWMDFRFLKLVASANGNICHPMNVFSPSKKITYKIKTHFCGGQTVQ